MVVKETARGSESTTRWGEGEVSSLLDWKGRTDHLGASEAGERSASARSHVAHPNHRLEELLIRARGLIGHSNVVSLHIEDEKPSLVLGHRFGIGQFGRLYPEETTEYTVHGSEGEGHPTGGAQELTAVHAQVTSLLFGVSNDLLL